MLPAIKNLSEKEDQDSSSKTPHGIFNTTPYISTAYLEFQQQWKRAMLEMKILIHHPLTM